MAKATQNWGFIGCGNLAQAVILGCLKKNVIAPRQVFASDKWPLKLNSFAKKTKIRLSESNQELLRQAQIIFLATKPQDLLAVLHEIKPLVTDEHVIVSLAAGVEASLIRTLLPKAGAVIRVMANTPAQIQKGVYGIYFAKADGRTKATIADAFANIGLVVPLKNDKQVDSITSGSASGVGFVFEFMRVFESWFCQQGFDRKSSRHIVQSVFEGSAKLAEVRSGESLEALREAVTSKKGTTFSGLRSMKRSGLQKSIIKGLNSAQSRAGEISKSLRKGSKSS